MPNIQNIDNLNLLISNYSGIARGCSTPITESLSTHSLRVIKSYNYIPKNFLFHHVNDEDKLYLGVELEIDSGGKK